jgi:penicillin-binding protein 2
MMRRRRYRRVLFNGVEPDEIFVDAAALSRDPIGDLEGKIERPLARISSLAFAFFIAAGAGYLAWRGFYLQIASGDTLYAQSQENRFSSRTIYAPRGIIRDRFGEPLVENTPSFGVAFDRAEFTRQGGNIADLEQSLAGALNISPESLLALGFPSDGDVRKMPPRIFVAQDIPADAVVDLAPKIALLPGVEIFESFRRTYADPRAFSHVLGFVGRVSAQDAAARPELTGEETVGKSGLEIMYDAVLQGVPGKKIVETDSHGGETRFRMTRESRQGDTLDLALDGALQAKAYEIVDHYVRGAHGASVVALDPRTGAVRALVSYPGFDSNQFGQGIGADAFGALVRDPLTPMFNRAIAGEFPSGSTIKPLVATAALEEKIIDPEKKIYDPGYIDIPNPYQPGVNTRFPDWRPQGWVDMYDAIAYSANVYFYIIGGGYRDQRGLGIEKLKNYLTSFGLGSRLGIDLPGEKGGLIPDPAWKKTAEPDNPIWRIGDTYHASIGQGGTKATPLQMVAATAAIANGGTLWRPYIVEARYDAQGAAVERHKPDAIRTGLAHADSLGIVMAGMRQTVVRGTARLLQDVPVPVAAKTGTAQNVPGKPPHAWVTVVAPSDNPELVLVVMVEHAGEGATVAVPITNEILQWYFSGRSG